MFISEEHITPMGRQIINKVLDAIEALPVDCHLSTYFGCFLTRTGPQAL